MSPVTCQLTIAGEGEELGEGRRGGGRGGGGRGLGVFWGREALEVAGSNIDENGGGPGVRPPQASTGQTIQVNDDRAYILRGDTFVIICTQSITNRYERHVLYNRQRSH